MITCKTDFISRKQLRLFSTGFSETTNTNTLMEQQLTNYCQSKDIFRMRYTFDSKMKCVSTMMLFQICEQEEEGQNSVHILSSKFDPGLYQTYIIYQTKKVLNLSSKQ